MISLQELRKIDPELQDLNDIELDEIRAALYELGQLGFDIWWQEKSGSKNPVGSLTSPTEDVSIKP